MLVQFLDEDVAPANFAAVGLQLDRPAGDEGLALVLGSFAIPKVGEGRFVHHELAIELNRYDLADHLNVKGIPLAERFVSKHERIAARGAGGAVVPKTARTLVSADLPFAAFLGGVPNLHLRHAAQVNTAVGLGDRLVIHVQLKVAIVFHGAEVQALAIIDENTVFHGSVLFDVFKALGLLFGEGVFAERHPLFGVLRSEAPPAL